MHFYSIEKVYPGDTEGEGVDVGGVGGLLAAGIECSGEKGSDLDRFIIHCGRESNRGLSFFLLGTLQHKKVCVIFVA